MNPGGGLTVRGSANAPPKLLTVRADALQMADGTPLKNIEKHRSQDVLCGRGGGTNHHVGNAHWRKLVNTNKRLYLSLPKKQKALVAKSIVHAVRAQNPPGRFLARDPSTSLWCDIGDQKATEKTSQALREGAPDIRTEMAKEGQMEKGNIVGGIMLHNGLIVDQNKSGAEKGTDPCAQAGMPPANPLVSSSQGGLPMLDGEDASMVMAFQQYLGGKNQNPSTATQPAPTQPAPTLPTSTIPTKHSSTQAPSLQQHQQPHQQPQLLGALASRQLLHSDLGRETYQQTLMSRKMSGSGRSVLDTRFMTNPQHLNFGNGTSVSYDELTQRVADRSARAGLQMTNQAASAMRQQPGQIVPSMYNDGLWSVPTGIPLESQRMTDFLRSSSLSSASSLGRTNYPGSNNLTNNMLGNEASMSKGSNFISQAGPNTFARLLEQRNSLLANSLRGSAIARLDPTDLYSMISKPALRSESSFGGQFSHPSPPSDLGQFVGNNGTGLTSLHPSVSAVMAQMTFEEIMRNNRKEASHLNNVMVTQRLGHLNDMAIQQLSSSRDNAETSIPTTSPPKRGTSSTLDDLCRAAGLDDRQPGKSHSNLAEDLYKKDEEDKVQDFCNRAKTKKRPKTSTPKLGVNDSSLVDDDSDEDVIKYLTSKRKRDDSNASPKEDSKRSKLKTKGGEDLELDRFTQKGLRDDLLSRGVSLNRNFSQKIRSLPLSETLLDRGHSLAMSEISLDRGQSLNGIGLVGDNDGQFDDASEEDDDEAPTFASKTTKVSRGCTLGTINTFPLDM